MGRGKHAAPVAASGRDVDASHELTGESLDKGASAAWTAGEYDEAFRLRERAYSEYVASGDDAKAALVASILASDH